MNTFVPLEYYALVYFYFLLFVVVFAYLQSTRTTIDDAENLRVKNGVGVFLLLALIAYIGTRPVSGLYFGDMRVYAMNFEEYASGAKIIRTKDLLFEYMMKFSAGVMSLEFFFILCAFLYIFPLYRATKRMFGDYWFYGFLMIVASFSFWSFGTNGLRNGIATSLFLLALAQERKVAIVIFMALAISFHQSMFIPITAYTITYFHKKPKTYLGLWFLAIPLSLALGGFWENFFNTLGIFSEERTSGYLASEGEFDEQFSSLGFRWDFLLYSATGTFAGWYFIIKKKFEDRLYTHMYNIYLLANTFWILVIRASFSNRFAYLSWFMLAVVIIYPLLKNQFFERQHRVVGTIMLLYFLFTFVLTVVLA
jgi:hypothetical protein